jgi:hypothetical protein
MTLKRAIIDRALKLIAPKPEQKETCVAMIEEHVAVLGRAYLAQGAGPSPGKLKKQFKDIAADLRRIKQSLESSTYAPALLWKTACGDADSADESGQAKNLPAKAFLGELDRLIAAAEFLHGAIVVRPGARRWDNVKAVTASLAAKLLTTFSARPLLTASRGGAFYRLATLLYEAVTGEVVSLEQYCRDVLDKADEPGGGRIEPSIVVRIPPR